MARSFAKSAYVGNTVVLNLAITRDGTPVNLTGAAIWCTGKNSLADADASAVFQKTIGAGVVVTNAAGGLATVTIAPTDTSTLTNAEHTLELDVQLRESDGRLTTVAQGQLTLLPRVTRAA